MVGTPSGQVGQRARIPAVRVNGFNIEVAQTRCLIKEVTAARPWDLTRIRKNVNLMTALSTVGIQFGQSGLLVRVHVEAGSYQDCEAVQIQNQLMVG